MSVDPRSARKFSLQIDSDSDSGRSRQRDELRDVRGRDASRRRLSATNPNLASGAAAQSLNLLAARRASWAPTLPVRRSSASPLLPDPSTANTGNASVSGTLKTQLLYPPPSAGDRVRRPSHGQGTLKRRMSHSQSSATPRTRPRFIPDANSASISGDGSGDSSNGPPTPSAFHLNLPTSSNLLTRRASLNLNSLLSALPPEPLSIHRSYHHQHHHSQSSNLANYQFGTASSELEEPISPIIPDPPAAATGLNLGGEAASPPEDGGNFKKSLQIDMKDLVGDAVGNMSISPSFRDVVLAARRGLFIIDLEAPLEVPRFLPQGGTWDVADVQWNPHPQRAEYIVSTSSEKLLIWNLLLHPKSKTSIEHILHAHYRAITHINWHTSECDVVCSTGIDSWVWGWDLRVGEGGSSGNGSGPRKPVFGLSAFNSGGTQVKWNRLNANILASSHADEVLVWDRRKGSLPLLRIPAHTSKIYGIDWSHTSPSELVTCSLDKTIKVWDVGVLPSSSSSTSFSASFSSSSVLSSPSPYSAISPTAQYSTAPWNTSSLASAGQNANTEVTARLEPKIVFDTPFPVWRARNLPFGRGILSLAQRGETALEMYARVSDAEGREVLQPVERFEGHTDVVKEFVWRRAGGISHDGTDFQLITWSKDRTLRFWPVDKEIMEKVGYSAPTIHFASGAGGPHTPTSALTHSTISFRSPPPGAAYPSLLSAPMAPHRSILAEVRAQWPPTVPVPAPTLSPTSPSYPHNHPPPPPQRQGNIVMQPHIGSAARASVLEQMMSEAMRARDRETGNTYSQANPIGAVPVGSMANARTIAGSIIDGNGVGGPSLSTTMAMTSGSGGAGETMIPVAGTQHQGGTMSRGGFGVAMDPFAWLSNVKVGAAGSGGGGTQTQQQQGQGGAQPPTPSQPGPQLQQQQQQQGQAPPGAGGKAGSDGPSLTRSGSMTALRASQRVGSRGADLASGVNSREGSRGRKRGEASGSRGAEERREREREKEDGNQTLQDEITSVLTKLASSKIKLEKHDLLKRRTCTLGLHGPWGENSSVFMRVSFTFPKGYPSAEHPLGTPLVELERSPLISMQDRAFILRRLRGIRETRRPCLEACLRFLLFANEEEEDPEIDDEEDWSSDDMDSMKRRKRSGEGVSDDDDDPAARKSREYTVSLLRNNKNLAEPRTSQGTFGPNGELVCFFRAPPRYVGNVLRGITDSPLPPLNDQELAPQSAITSFSSAPTSAYPASSSEKTYQSPSLVTDAVRRLTLAARDRVVKPIDPRKPDQAEHLMKVMTNFLTLAGLDQKGKAKSTDALDLSVDTEASSALADADGGVLDPSVKRPTLASSGPAGQSSSETVHPVSQHQPSKSFLLPPVRRSTVFIAKTVDIAGGDKKVAAEYVFGVSVVDGTSSSKTDPIRIRAEATGTELVKRGSDGDEDGDDDLRTLADVCEKNASVANSWGRFDHERIWRLLKTLFPEKRGSKVPGTNVFSSAVLAASPLLGGEVGVKMVLALLDDFAKCKDVQMLAMTSTILLQAIAQYEEHQRNIANAMRIAHANRYPTSATTFTIGTGILSGSGSGFSNQSTGTSSSKGSPSSSVLFSGIPPVLKLAGSDYFNVTRSLNMSIISPSSGTTISPVSVSSGTGSLGSSGGTTTSNTGGRGVGTMSPILERTPSGNNFLNLTLSLNPHLLGGGGPGGVGYPGPGLAGNSMLLSSSSAGSATSNSSSPITPYTVPSIGMMGPPALPPTVISGLPSYSHYAYHGYHAQVHHAHQASSGSTGSTGSISTLVNSTGSLPPTSNAGSGGTNANPGAGNSASANAQSTRASWSSLFGAGAGSVRQFMSGVGDTLKEGLTTPSHEVPPALAGATGTATAGSGSSSSGSAGGGGYFGNITLGGSTSTNASTSTAVTAADGQRKGDGTGGGGSGSASGESSLGGSLVLGSAGAGTSTVGASGTAGSSVSPPVDGTSATSAASATQEKSASGSGSGRRKRRSTRQEGPLALTNVAANTGRITPVQGQGQSLSQPSTAAPNVTSYASAVTGGIGAVPSSTTTAIGGLGGGGGLLPPPPIPLTSVLSSPGGLTMGGLVQSSSQVAAASVGVGVDVVGASAKSWSEGVGVGVGGGVGKEGQAASILARTKAPTQGSGQTQGQTQGGRSKRTSLLLSSTSGGGIIVVGGGSAGGSGAVGQDQQSPPQRHGQTPPPPPVYGPPQQSPRMVQRSQQYVMKPTGGSGSGGVGGGSRTNSGGKVVVSRKKVIVVEETEEVESPPPIFTYDQIQQLLCHVYVYAEMLFGWELYHKRVELLKTVWRFGRYPGGGGGGGLGGSVDGMQHMIGLTRLCPRCRAPLDGPQHKTCRICSQQNLMAACSICRLPVKGLSKSCLKCMHVSHLSCWNALNVPICPTGCGCFCNGMLIVGEEEQASLSGPGGGQRVSGSGQTGESTAEGPGFIPPSSMLYS